MNGMREYTLQTPYGTFEGDSAKEAAVKARAAELESKKASAQAAACAEIALGRAEREAYTLYSLALREGGPPRGVRFHGIEDASVDKRVLRAMGGHDMNYETPDGRAMGKHYGYTVLGVIMGCSGFDRAVVLRDGGGGKDVFLAVGVAETIAAFADMPGLDWRVFEHKEE